MCVVRSLTKKRRLDEWPGELVAISVRPGVFPRARVLAVLGLVPEPAMVPAKGVLSRGGGSRGRTLRTMGSGRTASSRVIRTGGEGGHQVCKAREFFTELFDV